MSWFQPTTTSLFAASSKNSWFSDPKARKELNHENKTLQTPFRLLSGTPCDCPAILIFGEDWFDIIPCNHLYYIAPINHCLKRALLNLDQSIGLCHTLGVVWWRRCEKLVGTKIEVEIFLKNTLEKWWKICPKIRKLVLFFTASFVRIFVGVQTKRHTYIPLSSCPFQHWPMTTSQKSLEHLQSQTFLSFCMRRDRKKRNYAKYANVFKWKSNTRWDFWQILGAGERCVQSPLGEDYEWTFCTFSTFFHIKPNAHKIQLMVIYLSRWT